MSDKVEKLKQQLEAADKQIGWLKGDKTRLSKSIKIGERAMDSLLDMEEKVSKQLAEAEQQLAELQATKMRWEVAAEDYRTKIVPKYKKQLAEAEQREEALREALERIQTWANAYPIEAFPKPDLEKAAEVLKAAGMTLDSISADAMRYALSGVKGIVEAALKESQQ